jgi:hypothetical protein
MGTTGPKEDKELEAIKKDEKVQRALSETSVVAQKESPDVVQKQVPFLGITAIVFFPVEPFIFF